MLSTEIKKILRTQTFQHQPEQEKQIENGPDRAQMFQFWNYLWKNEKVIQNND